MGKQTEVELVDQFSELGRQIAEEVIANITDTVNAIEGSIKGRLWDKRIPVRVDTKDPTLVVIKVGSRKRFWPGFAEFGTVHQGSRPVVTPAAERQKQAFLARAKKLEEYLHGVD